MKRIWFLLVFVLVGCSLLRSEFFRDQADFLYTQANTAYSEGRFDEAKEGYEEVIALDPAYSEAYVGLGHTAMVQGRRVEAVTYYEKALSLNPELRSRLKDLIYAAYLDEKIVSKDFSTHLLEDKFHQGRYKEIIEELRHKSPLTDADNFWLIRSFIRRREYKRAASVVKNMFADQAALEKLTERMGHLDAFLSKGHAEALADFRTLARMNPGCQVCQYLYGIILFNNSSHYDEAIKIFEGLRKSGFCPKFLLRDLAIAYEKSDRIIEAIDTYKQLGDNPFAYERLKSLYLKLGDMEEVKFYEELLQQGSSK